jgi:CO/xanthine dehydrogenase Mo-binding subunit
VPRFSEVPKIEVVLLDRKDIPSAGAGETPIVGVAPAIANALFSAAGIRVRSMPILPAFRRAWPGEGGSKGSRNNKLDKLTESS